MKKAARCLRSVGLFGHEVDDEKKMDACKNQSVSRQVCFQQNYGAYLEKLIVISYTWALLSDVSPLASAMTHSDAFFFFSLFCF